LTSTDLTPLNRVTATLPALFAPDAAPGPGGHPKLLHLGPGQNPPPGSGGTVDDYAW
jgi:hypothetical protein